MAPMTRSRALPDGTPSDLIAEYYGPACFSRFNYKRRNPTLR
ncbi:hypothetical protein [Peribacillus sp. AS_2]|nr:hypothetical protein [Peribacillus sp. AS_2]